MSRRPHLCQTALLHHGGKASSWGNLGLWPTADRADRTDATYATAAAALARRVGAAAGVARGDRVLELACGRGDGLLMWLHEFGVASAHGVDVDPGAVQSAQQQTAREVPRVEVRQGSAMAGLPHHHAGFDAVLCVDAAYHLSPRARLLASVREALRPGGGLAFTDLVVERRWGGSALLLRSAARLCGVSADDLVTVQTCHDRLAGAGFTGIAIERLDDAVLGGFTRFVQAQRRRLGARARGPGWRRIAVTAALIPPCRAAGLGYALISARRPPADRASRPP